MVIAISFTRNSRHITVTPYSTAKVRVFTEFKNFHPNPNELNL